MKSIYYLIFLFIISCQACFKEYPSESSLEKKYDVVFAILAPDSAVDYVRPYKTEVFVGKMVPAKHDNIFFIEGVKDTVLHALMYCARQHFRSTYEYDDNAKVFLEGDGQNVELTYIDKGIYRDVNSLFTVKAKEKYSLRVQKSNGETWSAETTVPGDIKVTSILNDTIFEIPKLPGYADTVLLGVSSDGGEFYFVFHDKRSNFDDIVSHSFSNQITPAIDYLSRDERNIQLDYVNVRWQIYSVNKDYGLFHTPCGPVSVSPEFFEFEKKIYDMHITDRSNISGKDVVGVFGAYNATVKTVVVKALWDQAKKTANSSNNNKREGLLK